MISRYNVQIKGSTYAKYYFELRSLFKDETEFPLTPLQTMRAQILEDKSKSVRPKSNTVVLYFIDWSECA